MILSLLSITLLPLRAERFARPFHEQMRGVAEPARTHLTHIHVALALQGSALHDFAETRDALFLRRYRDAREDELRAYAALDQLVASLGFEVQQNYGSLRRLERDWHALVERFVNAASRQTPSDPLRDDVYDDLLVAAGRLDETISAAARGYRARILQAERWERRVTWIIAAFGLLALLGVALLARRLQAVAGQAEHRRLELQRTVDSRARLIRGLSHDLKNPLGAIDGHAQLLEDGIQGPLSMAQAESISRIRRAVGSLLSLVHDLLELSRVEGGYLAIVPRVVHVDALVAAVAEEHRAAAAAAGHQLAWSVAEGLPAVRTDAARVRQILGNLLSNAIKFTPRGGHLTLHTELRAHAGTARALAIDVSDDGPGIPPTKFDEVFDEFSRLDVHASTPGTGLGLAIARQIARMLGGDITLASRTGEGATFTLWLPLDGRSATIADPPHTGT